MHRKAFPLSHSFIHIKLHFRSSTKLNHSNKNSSISLELSNPLLTNFLQHHGTQARHLRDDDKSVQEFEKTKILSEVYAIAMIEGALSISML